MLIRNQFNKQELDNHGNAADSGYDQFMFVLTILDKNQRNQVKIFLRKCIGLIKDYKFFFLVCSMGIACIAAVYLASLDDKKFSLGSCEEARVKLTNTNYTK